MSSYFDSLSKKMYESIDKYMGEPVVFYNGSIKYPDITAIVDRSANTVYPKHNRIIRLKSHTVLIELYSTLLPDVPLEQLDVGIDDTIYDIVDDCPSGDRVFLALVKKSNNFVGSKNTDFFNVD